MASSIPSAVGDLDDELENAVFHEKQGIAGDAPSSTISRLLCCLRNRCLRGICVFFPCVVFLLVFLSLPSSATTTTRRAFLILAAIPPIVYIFVGMYTGVLAYCTQVSLDTQNARAAHNYLNTIKQQSKIAVTTGQKQQSSNFPGRFALFLEAARSGDMKTAQLCLRNEQNVDEVDHLGRTALHWAALSGSDEVLSLLLRNGASVDQQDTLDGLTALHYAAFYGHIKSTRLLVGAGASMTIMDNRRMNPLQLTEMASLKLASVQPTHQMIIKYLRVAMKDDVTPPLENVAGLTVLRLVERQAHNLPQME
ncbi:Ankyrin repeat domain-containing protein 2 [Phytophthora nicotianae]|nr:Ankyrin repeat domain-containing protein 2 [Phytophthora nicotianae]